MSSSDRRRPSMPVRSVWAWNLEREFSTITTLLRRFPFVVFDTGFPGFLYRSVDRERILSPHQRYLLLKSNVDNLQLTQLGLTLCDADGNLPGFAWEFHFRDFDIGRHPDRSRHLGIDSRRFAALLCWSGLVARSPVCRRPRSAGWIAFHGCYDFGYLMKVLGGGQPLPDTLEQFLGLVHLLLGVVVDVKYMMQFCGDLYGGLGLERLAGRLRVTRSVGTRPHQAGSDSLLTCRVFLKMKEKYFHDRHGEAAADDDIDRTALLNNHIPGVIYGLQVC